MKKKYIYITCGTTVLLVALVSLLNKPLVELPTSNQQPTSSNSAITTRPHKPTPRKNDETLFPKGIFEDEPEISFHTIINGNGYDAATYFKHDTTNNIYYNFGFMVDRTIMKDPNKIELRMGEDGSFQYMKANEGKFPTWYEGGEAKKHFLEHGIGSLKYGSNMAKKYPEALYYQAMRRIYSTNNPSWNEGSFEEVLIYPVTLTHDRRWNYPDDPDHGNYKTHEGLLIITCRGIDYMGEIYGMADMRVPLIGELRRLWRVEAYEIDENATSEFSRFTSIICDSGAVTYEKIKEN